MSEAFERVGALVRRIQDGSLPAEALSDLAEDIQALDRYQRSGLWLQDYEADEAGAFASQAQPGCASAAICRSVLSQDGLYNLLLQIDAFRSGQ